MEGLPLRGVGRPRDEHAARRTRVLRQRLEAARSEVAEWECRWTERDLSEQARSDRLLLGLLFYGQSLRSAAECLRLAFPEWALSKSGIEVHLKSVCAQAETLFQRYFQGQGRSAACDEIYLSGHPTLEVVEPRSLAITGIQPDTEPTEEAWLQLLGAFQDLESAASDQGKGVSAALAHTLQRVSLDIWHLLRHFAAAVGRLETHAYDRIQDEEDKVTAFVAALPAPPGPTLPPALHRLEEAEKKCVWAIQRYDAAQTVLGWLYEAVKPVDVQGRVRTREQIQGDWEAALDLIDSIDAEELYKLEKKLRGKVTGAHAVDLSARLIAVSLPPGWQAAERDELQRLVCQAWYYHHRQQTHILQAPKLAAATVAARLGLAFTAEHLEPYCCAVFEVLDRTLIASSAVECVNSIIRLRQGGKRHPYPGFVYLLAWLHNTRPFAEGRRKGLTPAQILGVELPADGWDMLLGNLAA